jgi:hypothetical protein
MKTGAKRNLNDRENFLKTNTKTEDILFFIIVVLGGGTLEYLQKFL